MSTATIDKGTVDKSSGWSAFVAELQERILPLYKQHELTFDPFGVHGRIHICRSVVFAEWMARFYADRLPSADIDFDAVRVATAMHDVGRRGNGPDLWESDSAEKCKQYVAQHSPRSQNGEYPLYVASLIDKQPSSDPCKRIVHDADVLEIMRPCCGHGGLNGFRRDFLHFAGASEPLAGSLPDAAEIREALILEAWKWITETERIKLRLFNSSTFLADLLHKLGEERQSYPLLATLV